MGLNLKCAMLLFKMSLKRQISLKRYFQLETFIHLFGSQHKIMFIKTFYASDYRIYNQLNGISLGGTG